MYKDDSTFESLDAFVICDVPDDQLNSFHGILGRDGYDDISLDLINVY